MVDKEYTFSDGTRIFNEKKNGRFQRFIEYSYTQEQIEMMKKSPNMEKVLSHYISIRKYNAGKYYYLNVLWGISASLDQDGKIQLYKKLKDVHDKIGIVNESNILNHEFVSLFGKYYGLTEIHGAAFFATIYLAMLDCEEWKKDTPVKIPDDAKEAFTKADEYTPYDVQSRSKMFGIEVLCNYCDMDALQEAMEYAEEEFDLSEGIADWYTHYINGKKIEDECPDYLLIYAKF